MPWATIPWNLSVRAYSSSTWAGFTSPDITANSSMSRQLNVRSSAALSPTSISSNVRFSISASIVVAARSWMPTRGFPPGRPWRQRMQPPTVRNPLSSRDRHV